MAMTRSKTAQNDSTETDITNRHSAVKKYSMMDEKKEKETASEPLSSSVEDPGRSDAKNHGNKTKKRAKHIPTECTTSPHPNTIIDIDSMNSFCW